ncbi:MAG: SRPBCC domain-containing protein [Thermoleophilia bacterium]|nr:SRPBCC domain-containing protein [Thermoleophilia bacterium]
MSVCRRGSLLGCGLVLAALLALVSLGIAAVTERPARTVRVEREIAAPPERVWEVLTAFEEYPEWNPVITRVRGQLVQGSTLRLRLELPGSEPDDVEANVSEVRPVRLLGWDDRLFLPGLRDREYQLSISGLGSARTLLSGQVRFEGLLAPFVGRAAVAEGLERMVDALALRVTEPAEPG